MVCSQLILFSMVIVPTVGGPSEPPGREWPANDEGGWLRETCRQNQQTAVFVAEHGLHAHNFDGWERLVEAGKDLADEIQTRFRNVSTGVLIASLNLETYFDKF